METKSLLMAVAFALCALLPGSAYAYTTQIHAPAVLQNQDMGILTALSLNVTNGTGITKVVGPDYVNSSTTVSAQIASQYASAYLGINYSKHNFIYTINGTENVSGPSAGLAFTLLADYGLRHLQLYKNFTVTGTIAADGTVGPVGGLFDKIWAASSSGIKYFVAPTPQSGTSQQFIYYIAQQTFNIPVATVGNFVSALPYASGVAPNSIAQIQPIVTQSYNLSRVPQAPLQCTSPNCNQQDFNQISNFTFNMVNNSISNITSNYSYVSRQLAAQLAQDENISAKGYLYAGADLAFLEYPYTVVLDNAPDFVNKSTGAGLMNQVNYYCSQLSVPQLTSTNYDYLVGGEVRQAFAVVNLKNAEAALNASESTDDVVNAVSTASQSYAWCNAAQEMYGIAAQIGGTPVTESSNLKLAAASALHNVTDLPGLYLQAGQWAYNNSEYSAALYAAGYVQVFQNSPYLGNVTDAELASINATAYKSTFGIWPVQFANSALFYAQQARLGGPNAVANLNSAYTLARIAAVLSADNQLISSNFGPSNMSITNKLTDLVYNQSTQLSILQYQLGQAYSVIIFMGALLTAAWVVIGMVVYVGIRQMFERRRSSQGHRVRRKRQRR